MDMKNITEGNGYVTQGDLLMRMHRFRPPRGDYYLMRKMKGSDFAEIGVSNPSFKGAMMKLFKIYAGTKELYDYIRQLYTATATALNETAKYEEWEPNANN